MQRLTICHASNWHFFGFFWMDDNRGEFYRCRSVFYGRVPKLALNVVTLRGADGASIHKTHVCKTC